MSRSELTNAELVGYAEDKHWPMRELASEVLLLRSRSASLSDIIRHLHETSERAPDVRDVPMRLVRQDAFDELLAFNGDAP